MADDYAQAAVRHYRDAEILAELGRFDNAGYLMGFAAECAMKKKLRDLHRNQNMKFDGHHPEPQRQIRIFLQGRGLGGPWLALASDRNLFAGWRVEGRYAPDGHVSAATYQKWKSSAERVLSETKLRWKGAPVRTAAPKKGETNAS
jgi:hypothetical protein